MRRHLGGLSKHGGVCRVQHKGCKDDPPRGFGLDPVCPGFIQRRVGRRVRAQPVVCRAVRGAPDEQAAASHQGQCGVVVDVRPLVEEARGIHLLVDLYEQQGLVYPEFGGSLKLGVHEYLPSEMPDDEMGQLGDCLGYFWAVDTIQCRRADGDYSQEKEVGRAVGDKGRAMQNGQLRVEVVPVRFDVCSRHAQAQDVIIVIHIALQERLLANGRCRARSLVESRRHKV